MCSAAGLSGGTDANDAQLAAVGSVWCVVENSRQMPLCEMRMAALLEFFSGELVNGRIRSTPGVPVVFSLPMGKK